MSAVGDLMTCGCRAQGTIQMPGEKAKPGCGLHWCSEPWVNGPDLAGRLARCSDGNGDHGEVPSSTDLAFFKYLGPGSPEAAEMCKCGYLLVAHQWNHGRVSPEPIKCKVGGFAARGPLEFDRYYCGCRGWD